MTVLDRWKERAGKLRMEVYAISLAYRDPRTPWYAKVLIFCVVGYAFSPIDLIPDFIPILGYVDDLLLVPVGIALVLKMIPPTVLGECRERARNVIRQKSPGSWVAASVIILIWLLSCWLVFFVLRRKIRGEAIVFF